ncbi:MAG: UDP-3-O-(3-hydroxymyristoyl)glucosamine N-acyltransferase, partial [Gammaproteobacteria bacterium]|nr:UDP-3-O-(3-hydroxymyristoyl)glucosamine N-acyltransferase [Gammaproteobacteria bacterium]
MKFTAAQIAGILEGEVVGNPDAVVFKLAKIEDGTKGSLTFLANPKYVNFIYTTEATITIVNNDFVPENELTTTLIKVEDAYQSFSKLLEYYNQVKLMRSGIEEPSVISENVIYGEHLYLGSFSYIGKNVNIGNNVKIYPNCFIGDNVTIGDNCIFFAGVKIYSETVIGNNCNFHSGCVVGSDGFGFAPTEDGTYNKIPQIGNVIIE